MDKIEFREDKITFSYKKSYGECLYQDLIAVEYSKPYCILQIGGRNSILFLISLRVILEKLPADFLLINRGIIVNKERIVDCVLQDGAYHIKMDNNKIIGLALVSWLQLRNILWYKMILFRLGYKDVWEKKTAKKIIYYEM